MISCILPTYNGEKYIKESIESILNQTYTNWELIVIDDCSTDATPEILKELSNENDKIKVYRNEKNEKLPRSLNDGFAHAIGDYLTWTSDDNIYKKNAFEVMRKELVDNPSVGFVFSRMDYIDERGNVTGQSEIHTDLKRLKYANIIGASFMYRYDVYKRIGEYNPEKFLVEDYDYWLRISRVFPISYIADSLYYYRQHAGSLTSTKFRQAVLQNVKLLEETLEVEDLSADLLAIMYAELANKYYILDDFDKMKRYVLKIRQLQVDDVKLSRRVRRAILLGPTFMKYYKKLKRK